MTEKESKEKIGNLALIGIKRYELIIVLVILLSFIGKILEIDTADIFFVLSTGFLSVLYFVRAFAKIDIIFSGGLDVFTNSLYSYSLSLTLLGVLFRLNQFPGYTMMLMVGLITLFITTVLIIYLISQKSDSKVFNTRSILRALIILMLGAFLWLTPTDTLVELEILEPIDNTEQFDINKSTTVLKDSTKQI